MNAVERVKKICKERKIPISKLEKDCGFSNGYISQLKKGVFPNDRIAIISDYLCVSNHFLTTGEEYRIPNIKNVDEHYELIMLFDELSEEQQKLVLNMMKNMKKEKE